MATTTVSKITNLRGEVDREVARQLNLVMADVRLLKAEAEQIRADLVATRTPICTENGSADSDLDYTATAVLDGSDALVQVPAGTITTIATTTVTGTKWGTFTIQVALATGVVSTVVPSATQAYDSAALALAAAEPAATGNLPLAVVLIDTDSGDWVANTDSFSDDLTAFAVYSPNDPVLQSTVPDQVDPASLDETFSTIVDSTGNTV